MALPPTDKRAATDEAFLREVDDAVRAGDLAHFWKTYGRWLLLVVVLGLGVHLAVLDLVLEGMHLLGFGAVGDVEDLERDVLLPAGLRVRVAATVSRWVSPSGCMYSLKPGIST